MRRRNANLFAAVLGVLCLALVVLGVRSFWVDEHIRQIRLDPVTSAIDGRGGSSQDGYLLFDHGQDRSNDPSRFTPLVSWWTFQWPDGEWHFSRSTQFYPNGGVWWDSIRPEVTHTPASPMDGTGDYWAVQIPYWIPILLTGTWPVIRFTRPILRRRRETRRHRRKQCVNCGYDLRAHKPGEKCPECGRQIAAADAGNGGAGENDGRGIAGDLRKPVE